MMMRSLSIALSAVFVAASVKPHFARSEIAVAEAIHHHDLLRHLQQSVDDMTNSVTEGPVTLEQLQIVQTIIQELSNAPLPAGVDLTQVNVAVIITQVLQELDIDASAMSSGGALNESEMSTVVQEIINKASEILGVTTSTSATATTATTTTAVVAAESCSVCGEGFEVGNPLGILSLEGQPEVACGALQTAGENGVIPSEQCADLPGIITDVCECIPSSSATTTIPTTTTDATTAATPSCVCSPLSYTFTINFSKTCETNTIAGNPGIDNAICQITTVPPNDDSVDFSTLKVFDVQFLEVDTSGDLSVINQVDRFNVSLSDGDTITFDSVASKLNPNEPLADQLNYVPGGVLLALRARSDGSTAIVTNRPTWTYTNSCESLPLSVGDAIDWVTLTDLTEANPAFCPAVTTSTPTSSPTKVPTTAPVEPTDSPITSSPTKSPSLAPVVTTDSPITTSPTKSPSLAPVVTTDSPITTSPTKSPSLAPVVTTDSPITSSPSNSPSFIFIPPNPTKEPTLAPTPTQAKNPTLAPTPSPTSFGKAAKSKAGKGTKSSKSDPMAKVVKDGAKSSKSDPTAKAVKEGLGEGTKSSKSDQMAKTSKAADSVTTSVFSKTKQQKSSSKSSASLLFSKGSKSKEGGKQKQSKSASYSTKGGKTSDEAKAQKNSPSQSLGLDI